MSTDEPPNLHQDFQTVVVPMTESPDREPAVKSPSTNASIGSTSGSSGFPEINCEFKSLISEVPLESTPKSDLIYLETSPTKILLQWSG